MSASSRQGAFLQAADQAVVWFAVLQRARHRGNADRCQRAINELRRLGVRVLYAADAPPRNPAEPGDDATFRARFQG